eukprot:13906009-Ditylum_brightwellii.AAC.1
MSSTEQESKKAKRSTFLMENAIISSVHAAEEDLDIGINANNEQCSSNKDKDDVISSQSNSPNELTTFESNVSPTLMPLSTIEDQTSDVATKTDNDETLKIANITTEQSSYTLQESRSGNVHHTPVTARDKLCKWLADVEKKKTTRKVKHDCAM